MNETWARQGRKKFSPEKRFLTTFAHNGLPESRLCTLGGRQQGPNKSSLVAYILYDILSKQERWLSILLTSFPRRASFPQHKGVSESAEFCHRAARVNEMSASD